MRVLKGQCLCHGVEYEVEDQFSYAMNCHCSNCRRTTGSAFKPFGGIPVEQISITEGKDKTLRYGDAANHDLHCGVCGSLMFSVVREGRYAHVPFGTLIDEPSHKPTHHIFVGSKAPWFEILDDLPQYEEFD